MTPPLPYKQDVVPIGNGWYMARHVSEQMCSLMWTKMDEHQRDELRALYGNDDNDARRCMWEECEACEHRASFFDGATLVGLMWADWSTVGGMDGRVRVLGCFCNSEYARRHTMSFVKMTPECIRAFWLDEPTAVTEWFVFIAREYRQSRKWAQVFGGLEEVGNAKANGHLFACYRSKIGG